MDTQTHANGSTALATTAAPAPLATSNAARALEPGSIETAYDLAKLLVAGRMIPAAIRTPEAALTIIMAGRELGLTTMQSLRSIYFFDGKLTMSADLMIALARRSPVCKAIDLLESTDKVCRYSMQRVGEAKPTVFAFSLEDAKAAGLLGKDNWKKYPRSMLRARCASEGVRAMFSDLLLGVYDTDEIGPSAQRIPEMVIEEEPTDAWQPPAGEAQDVSVARAEGREDVVRVDLAACKTSADIDHLATTIKGRFSGEARARVAEAFAAKRKELAGAGAAGE